MVKGLDGRGVISPGRGGEDLCEYFAKIRYDGGHFALPNITVSQCCPCCYPEQHIRIKCFNVAGRYRTRYGTYLYMHGTYGTSVCMVLYSRTGTGRYLLV